MCTAVIFRHQVVLFLFVIAPFFPLKVIAGMLCECGMFDHSMCRTWIRQIGDKLLQYDENMIDSILYFSKKKFEVPCPFWVLFLLTVMMCMPNLPTESANHSVWLWTVGVLVALTQAVSTQSEIIRHNKSWWSHDEQWWNNHKTNVLKYTSSETKEVVHDEK